MIKQSHILQERKRKTTSGRISLCHDQPGLRSKVYHGIWQSPTRTQIINIWQFCRLSKGICLRSSSHASHQGWPGFLLWLALPPGKHNHWQVTQGWRNDAPSSTARAPQDVHLPVSCFEDLDIVILLVVNCPTPNKCASHLNSKENQPQVWLKNAYYLTIVDDQPDTASPQLQKPS